MRCKNKLTRADGVFVFRSETNDIISYSWVHLLKEVSARVIIQRNINSMVSDRVFPDELRNTTESHAGLASSSFTLKHNSISLSESVG
jgi:hypothetical protein